MKKVQVSYVYCQFTFVEGKQSGGGNESKDTGGETDAKEDESGGEEKDAGKSKEGESGEDKSGGDDSGGGGDDGKKVCSILHFFVSLSQNYTIKHHLKMFQMPWQKSS